MRLNNVAHYAVSFIPRVTSAVFRLTVKFLWIKVLRTLGWFYTASIWLYCDCFIWVYFALFVLICTVVVLYCFVMCVCVGFAMCGCLGNMYTVLCLKIFLTWQVFLTLSEVFPCRFLSCKANCRVKLAKTGHVPHSSTLVVICVVQFCNVWVVW